MADIRNDEYLHRPGAGRGAITPADPLESRLYDEDGNPINPATEETLDEILDAVGEPGDSAQTDPAQSASQIALLKGLLSVILSIKGTDGVKKIADAVTVSGLSELAKESTLGDMKTAVESIAGKDFATQTTLAAILAKLADSATSAKQDLIKGVLDTLATETTAGAIKSAVEALADLISNGVLKTALTGQKVEEVKTQADAVGGVVTFSSPITAVEILNLDSVNHGTFTVNGLAITVPRGSAYRSYIGGTPGTTVSVAGSTQYEIRRLA